MQKKYYVALLSRSGEIDVAGIELVEEAENGLLMFKAVRPYAFRLYLSRRDIGDTVYRTKEEAQTRLEETQKLCEKTLYCYSSRVGFIGLEECFVFQVVGPYIIVLRESDNVDKYKLFRFSDIGNLLYESPEEAKDILAGYENDLYLVDGGDIKTIGKKKVRRGNVGYRVFTDLACASTRKALDEDNFA